MTDLMSQTTKNERRGVVLGITLLAGIFLVTIFRSSIASIDFGSLLRRTEKTQPAVSSTPTLPQQEILYPSLSVEDFYKKVFSFDSFLILDIRDQNDFQSEHVIDSLNMPFRSIKENGFQLKKESSFPIVVVGYGADPEDVRSAADAIHSAGFEQISILDGGITAWKKKRYPIITIADPNSTDAAAKVTFIEPAELQQKITDHYPLYILDASDAASFVRGRIPGAVNIPLDQLEARRREIPNNEEIIVYGQTELIGFRAAVTLYDLGFMATKMLDGTPDQWSVIGYETTESPR